MNFWGHGKVNLYPKDGTEGCIGLYENLFFNCYDLKKRDEINYCKEEDGFNEEGEDENLKLLVAKFNNLNSLWNDGTIEESTPSNTKKSIWCFDTYLSPQSSTTPSPKLNEEDISYCYQSDGDYKNFDFWEPLGKYTSINFSISCLKPNNEDHPYSIKSYQPVPLKSTHENNTTLKNHGGDSLFIEVPSRAKKNAGQEPLFDKMLARKSSFELGARRDVEEESPESLLTSPKTHFQPIKQEPYEEESEDSSSFETDAEISRLVPCSNKCPNNGQKSAVNPPPGYSESRRRSLSTSLPELSLIMGPFTDSEPETSETCAEEGHGSSEDLMNERGTKKDSESISSSLLSSPEENEFEELCTMLNEVLRDENTSKIPQKDLSPSGAVWDWFDEDKDVALGKTEPRSSWGCYWDTFKPESPPIEDNLIGEVESKDDNIFGTSSLIKEGAPNFEDVDDYSLTNYGKDEMLFHLNTSEWTEESVRHYSVGQNESYEPTLDWSAGKDCDYNCTVPDDCPDPCQVFYSWNLEKEWQREESDANLTPAHHRRDTDYAGKRPCSFFMEGNCRRSDCKFSHDLGSITCKFWEEGSCFKGVMCPFLHGYPSEMKKGCQYGGAGNPKFTIESETDFPALITNSLDSLPAETAEAIHSPAKSKGKRDKQESNVLFRMVKKKRRKGGQQNYSEKAV